MAAEAKTEAARQTAASAMSIGNAILLTQERDAETKRTDGLQKALQVELLRNAMAAEAKTEAAEAKTEADKNAKKADKKRSRAGETPKHPPLPWPKQLPYPRPR